MRLNKRFEHMIKSIEAESGLIDDCTHIVYLNDDYTHEVFGDSFPVKNSKELNDFMEDVVQDVSNWFNYDESSKLEEQVKYNIAVSVEAYLNGHYDDESAYKATKAELLDRVYKQVTTTFALAGTTRMSNQLRYFGKKNIIELIELYLSNYSDVQDFIQRGEN